MKPGLRGIVVYGDFNCPFSALASARVTILERRNLERQNAVIIDWRAVQHEPELAAGGRVVPVAEVDGEMAEVARWMVDDEDCMLRPPRREYNTRMACEAYAGTDSAQRPELRRKFFEAMWIHGDDLGERAVVRQIAGTASDPRLAAQWQHTWVIQDRPVVPLMVLGDGVVSRGLSALVRLARMIGDRGGDGHAADAATDLGGEAPCLAHLVDGYASGGPPAQRR